MTVDHIYKRCRKSDMSNFLSVLSTLGLFIFVFPNLQLSCINKYNLLSTLELHDCVHSFEFDLELP